MLLFRNMTGIVVLEPQYAPYGGGDKVLRQSEKMHRLVFQNLFSFAYLVCQEEEKTGRSRFGKRPRGKNSYR